MRCVVFALLAGLAIAVIGCDKGPQSASPASSSPNANAPVNPPTTQQTLNSPRKNLQLKVMPLALFVPDGWHLNPEIGPSFLVGPAPAGPVQISISMLDSLAEPRRVLFISDAFEQGQQHPGRILVRQLTGKSGLQILEKITYAADITTQPSTQPFPTTLPSQLLSWSITVFVPYKQKFIPCTFDLLGLTQEQYNEDEPLIGSIIDTAQQVDIPAFQ